MPDSEATVSPYEALRILGRFHEDHAGHEGVEINPLARDIEDGEKWGVYLACADCGPSVTTFAQVDNQAYRRAIGAELSESRALTF